MLHSLYFVSIGTLLAISVLSTTYVFGNWFLYPRLLLAIAGFAIVILRPSLRTFIIPPLLLIPVGLVAVISALWNDNLDHILLLLSLIIRGIMLPYFAAIAVTNYIGLLELGNFEILRWRVVSIVCVALLVQTTVIMLQLTNQEFKSLYLEYVNLSEDWRIMANLGLARFSGIGGISIYDTAISYCILASISLIGSMQASTKNWLYAYILFSNVLLCAIHGRTGLIFSILLILMVILKENLKSQIALRILIIFVCLIVPFSMMITVETRDDILNSSGEVVINYLSSGSLRSDSSDDFLENHLYLPKLDTIIIGHAYWIQPGIELNMPHYTDSGVLLLIEFGGILLLSVMVFAITGMIYLINVYIAHGSVRGQFFVGTTRWWSLYLIMIFGAVSWKGPIFLSEHAMTSLFFVVIAKAAIKYSTNSTLSD